MEIKQLPLNSLELKFDEGMKFSGYASMFDGVDSYGDTVIKGAYADTLRDRKRPIGMRWNHYGEVIGKWVSLAEDEKGLFVKGELTPNHSKASDVYASLKHGAIDGMSIGYRVKDFEQTGDIRILKAIDLVEISIVEEPADLNAKIGEVKSLIDECVSLKDYESLLRDAGGFSRADAVTLVSRIKSTARSEYEAEMKARQEILDLFAKFNPAS